MAQVIGSLRQDKATYGEKIVLKLLKENLPKEYNIYVECPLPGNRNIRYPDFIILTNYGVVILEVKDWIQVDKADRFGATVRTRENKTRIEKNPVNLAREIALSLDEEIHIVRKKFPNTPFMDIPWGFAAILPNLPTSKITQLRKVWGEEFVLNKDDLDAPLILDRLKFTLPKHKVHPLTKSELDLVRATINPTVFLEVEGKPAVILNVEQEQIINEPIAQKLPEKVEESLEVNQITLFEEENKPEAIGEGQELPDYGLRLARNATIRLVRGVAGSGKTLVLTQRARYLAAQYPEWQILVLTFNKQLKQHFDVVFKGEANVKAQTFYGLCYDLMRKHVVWKEPNDADGWLEKHQSSYPILKELGSKYIADEIQWIKEMSIHERRDYLDIERRGRGHQRRLGHKVRGQIFDILLDYNHYLHKQKTLDWADIPQKVIDAIECGEIQPVHYDAILIDEAQDFAPIWLQVVSHFIRPDTGVLFLADDPAQSIYRFYSWRQKGIQVMGRTRWLRIPYRNTFEVYQAAFALIEGDELLTQALGEEGVFNDPMLDSTLMRHGERPVLQKFDSGEAEMQWIRSQIYGLLQTGINPCQIAVLKRRNSGLDKVQQTLRDLDVHINTYHAYKGLEFEVVFMTHLEETFAHADTPEDLSEERRLIYMAMTRARRQLYMSYQGRLPEPLTILASHVDQII